MKTAEEKSLAEDSGEGSSSSNNAVNLTPPPVLKVSFNIYIYFSFFYFFNPFRWSLHTITNLQNDYMYTYV